MQSREKLLDEIWTAQDEAYDLMVEYDGLPHRYGEAFLYQAEGQIIDLIAINPGTTISDLGIILKKTTSACSQIVRKLRAKGWVAQSRNPDNNRLYNLTLTEEGLKIYESHQAFTQNCREITYELLSGFSEEELEMHLRVQRKINEAYEGDVKRSRERFQKQKEAANS